MDDDKLNKKANQSGGKDMNEDVGIGSQTGSEESNYSNSESDITTGTEDEGTQKGSEDLDEEKESQGEMV